MVDMSASVAVCRSPLNAIQISTTDKSVKESVYEILAAIRVPPEISRDLPEMARNANGNGRDIENIISKIEASVEKIEDKVNIPVVTAETLEKKGRYKEAEEWWNQAGERLHESGKEFNKIESYYNELHEITEACGLFCEKTVAFRVSGKALLCDGEGNKPGRKRRRRSRRDD